MSGLSSRVMNMKFMRSGDDVKSEPTNSKAKVLDNSEWFLKDSNKIIASNTTPAIASVGYGDINGFNEGESDDETIPTPVKRTWGEDKLREKSSKIEFSSIKASQKAKSETPKEKGPTSKDEKFTPNSQPIDNNNSELDIPENIAQLDANDFLNSVFKPKKRAKEEAGSKSQKLKKRKRLQK